MAEKPDMGEIASFYKAELKKTETEENTLPTKETLHCEPGHSMPMPPACGSLKAPSNRIAKFSGLPWDIIEKLFV
uniref:Thymosin beta-10 n=1 Tax=Monodon monoceros TaxID=40151 RepID=A0A8C6AW74_MONMO